MEVKNEMENIKNTSFGHIDITSYISNFKTKPSTKFCHMRHLRLREMEYPSALLGTIPPHTQQMS